MGCRVVGFEGSLHHKDPLAEGSSQNTRMHRSFVKVKPEMKPDGNVDGYMLECLWRLLHKPRLNAGVHS